MNSARVVAVYDANILYPAPVRDLFVRLARAGLPHEAVAKHGMTVQHPDDFVLDLLSRNPGAVYAAARAQRTALRNPPLSVRQFLDNLRRVGISRTADALEGAADEL